MSNDRIRLIEQSQRRGFSIVYDELWTDYLPHIGGDGVLLYCFLKYMSGKEIPNPCSQEWGTEVCQVLGMSVTQSHSAWARLQEMGLILLMNGVYSLVDAQPRKAQADKHNREADSVFADVEFLFGRPLSMTEVQQIEDLTHSYADELIALAAELSVGAGALSMSYIKQVLLNWKAKGISTPEQAKADREEYQLKKAQRNSRKGRATISKEKAVTPRSVLSYEDETILRRIKQNFGDEVVGHGE